MARKEEWRTYKTTKACFEVSNYGNVRGEILNKPITVIINKNGRRCINNQMYCIYRFVWTLFNGPVPKGYVIHHIDHNKQNDRLDNLMLMTNEEHMKHHATGREQTEEKSSKISNAHKGKKWFNNGIIMVFAYECPDGFVKGRLPMTDEHKRKIAEANTGKCCSQETRDKISKSEKGRIPWNKGLNKETDERIAKYAEKESLTKNNK